MRTGKERVKNFFASVLWLMLTGCAAALPEFKGPLFPGEELVTLSTRPGVTVRVLLITPSTAAKGVFLFFPWRRRLSSKHRRPE
jgi:hypothetical protein